MTTLVALLNARGEVHLGLAVALVGLRGHRGVDVAWVERSADALSTSHDAVVLVDTDVAVPSADFVLASSNHEFVVGACPSSVDVAWDRVEAAVSAGCPPAMIQECGRTYGFSIEGPLDAHGFAPAKMTHPAPIVKVSRKVADALARGEGYDGPVVADVARPCSSFAPRKFASAGGLAERRGRCR